MLEERCRRFLPAWWERLVLLRFPAGPHRYASETPRDLLPQARGALTQEASNGFWNKRAALPAFTCKNRGEPRVSASVVGSTVWLGCGLGVGRTWNEKERLCHLPLTSPGPSPPWPRAPRTHRSPPSSPPSSSSRPSLPWASPLSLSSPGGSVTGLQCRPKLQARLFGD